MQSDDNQMFASPCGIYCIACPRLKDKNSCRGCRLDGRHNSCDIYACCVTMGGKNFCFECECFPCERLKEFSRFHPGKKFSHFRHISVNNLVEIQDKGLETWIEKMNLLVLSGEYTIQTKNTGGRLDMSQCPCSPEGRGADGDD